MYRLFFDDASVRKELGPIVEEVKETESVIGRLGKQGKPPVNKSLENIETAVVNNIRQEEEKIKPKGGFKVFTKKEVAIKEEAEQIENVQRYTVEDTVYKEGDKLTFEAVEAPSEPNVDLVDTDS